MRTQHRASLVPSSPSSVANIPIPTPTTIPAKLATSNNIALGRAGTARTTNRIANRIANPTANQTSNPTAGRAHARAAGEPDRVSSRGIERVRARAYELYTQRMHHGGWGDALSDWLSAERELNGFSGG
ncbi:MAG: hypothetical protein SFY95_01520 [Planctomycetota bacterium]|nr:hypothetical protein [Planctomycetota bacterium]